MNQYEAPTIFPVVVECNSGLIQQDLVEQLEGLGYVAYRRDPEPSQLGPIAERQAS